MSAQYTFPATNVDTVTFINEMDVAPFADDFLNAWLEIDSGNFVVVAKTANYYNEYEAIINSLLDTYVAQQNGPMESIISNTIEHDYAIAAESVIHTEPIVLPNASWIFVTLNGSSLVSPNDTINHRISINNGITILNDTIVSEGAIAGKPIVWSRSWWIYITDLNIDFEINVEFIPDVDSIEPYEQNTTMTFEIFRGRQ